EYKKIQRSPLHLFLISTNIEMYFESFGNANLPMRAPENPEHITRCADMFAAMGNDARLRIMRLLLSAHPQGLVVGDIQAELGIPNSTLSHHLEKLRQEELVCVRRDGSFLWYTANTNALQELLTFLYAECCTRNKAIQPEAIVQLCK